MTATAAAAAPETTGGEVHPRPSSPVHWWQKAIADLERYAESDLLLAALCLDRADAADVPAARSLQQQLAKVATRRATTYARVAAQLRRRYLSSPGGAGD